MKKHGHNIDASEYHFSLYHTLLLVVLTSVWTWAAINPTHAGFWLAENVLVFIVAPLIVLIGRYVHFSRLSYTLMTVFFILHLIGSHYTYSEVPFGFVFGEWLGTERNMYDRLVHFSFGLLFAYPIRELLLTMSDRKPGLWGFYFPFEVIIMLSAVYELLEWLAVRNADVVAMEALLGSQGDLWDAQKDIAAAMTGVLITLSLILLLHWAYNPTFWHELKASLSIRYHRRMHSDERLVYRMLRSARMRSRRNRAVRPAHNQ